MKYLAAALIGLVSMMGSAETKTASAKENAYKMNVLRTAYCLRGHTRTGKSTSYGIVAVDPNYIPMHSRMYIPGYGYGYAEDTGSLVKGRHIDVWVSSCDAAMGMTRHVTITVYH
jgi:3D (Asp-Asp-Asp) domain-containing protein